VVDRVRVGTDVYQREVPSGIRLVDAPLSLEPVLGWRVWRLTHDQESLRLQALATSQLWEPYEAAPASCFVRDHPGAPRGACTCGYHAAASVDHLATAGVFRRGVGVIGAIAMWGTVVEHARGARSEFAYPARLRLVCSPCLRTGAIVDPVTVAPGSPLVPLCDRHWRSNGAGHLRARAVEAQLLAAYGVELLPKPTLPKRLQRRLSGERAGILDTFRWAVGGRSAPRASAERSFDG
jgi:hypothetical protein